MKREQLLSKLKKILLKKAEGFFYTEEINEYQQNSKNDSEQISIFDESSTKLKKTKNNDQNKQTLNLILSKKKVTTHYIPPDMLAIKMLIENFGEKIKDDDDNLLSLSDEELYSLQENLIREIQQSMEENKNETWQMSK